MSHKFLKVQLVYEIFLLTENEFSKIISKF